MEHQTATNGLLTVGALAPNFRLASAQGPDITLEDYRGQRNVIVWLSRGLFCPFCRRYMTQLRLGYHQIQERGAEILQITWSTLEEARLYFQQYQLSFPYLCDPERAMYPLYGISMISLGGLAMAKNMAAGMTATLTDRLFHGEKTASPLGPMKRYGAGEIDQQAVFIVDKSGIIRYVHATSSLGGLPPNAEYLRQLEQLQ